MTLKFVEEIQDILYEHGFRQVEKTPTGIDYENKEGTATISHFYHVFRKTDFIRIDTPYKTVFFEEVDVRNINRFLSDLDNFIANELPKRILEISEMPEKMKIVYTYKNIGEFNRNFVNDFIYLVIAEQEIEPEKAFILKISEISNFLMDIGVFATEMKYTETGVLRIRLSASLKSSEKTELKTLLKDALIEEFDAYVSIVKMTNRTIINIELPY